MVGCFTGGALLQAVVSVNGRQNQLLPTLADDLLEPTRLHRAAEDASSQNLSAIGLRFHRCVSKHTNSRNALVHTIDNEDNFSATEMQNLGLCTLELYAQTAGKRLAQFASAPAEGAAASGGRHLTLARFSSSAQAVSSKIRTLGPEWGYTVYDKRGHADRFATALQNESLRTAFKSGAKGVVRTLRNRGDADLAYLDRIVKDYMTLGSAELFTHELEAFTVGKHLLQFASATLAPGATFFVPLVGYTFLLSSVTRRKFVGWSGALWMPCAVDMLYHLLRPLDHAHEVLHGPAEASAWRTQPHGQFLTSGSTIRRRPLEQWRFLRALVNGDLDSFCRARGLGAQRGRAYKLYSHVFERMWGFFLGERPWGRTSSELLKAFHEQVVE